MKMMHSDVQVVLYTLLVSVNCIKKKSHTFRTKLVSNHAYAAYTVLMLVRKLLVN